jgi:hypothetical protein
VSEFTEFDIDHFAKLARRRKVRERVREYIDRILDAQPFHERKWFRLSELVNHCAKIPGMLLSDSSRKEEALEIFRASIYCGDFGGRVGQSTRIRCIEPSAPRWLPRDSAGPNGFLFPLIGDLLISRADAATWFRRQGVPPPHGLAEPHDGRQFPKDWVATPAVTPTEAGPVSTRPRRRPQTSRLEAALNKIYPGGLPPLAEVPDVAVVRELKLLFVRENWDQRPDRRTIIRLLARLRSPTSDR